MKAQPLPDSADRPARERPTLADRTYAALHARVMSGHYASNEKLPSEKDLSAEYGVSRPVLRTALERLRDEGLIYSRQGAGNFVRAQVAQVTGGLGFQRVETIADIQRCYEFRLTIEGDAAALAAERRNDAALDEMDEALRLLAAATGSRLHREDADFAFHLAICRAANNQYYDATMRALRDHINVGMKMHGDALMSDGQRALEAVLAEHRAIREAIAASDGPAARELMRGHIKNSRNRLFGGGMVDLRL